MFRLVASFPPVTSVTTISNVDLTSTCLKALGSPKLSACGVAHVFVLVVSRGFRLPHRSLVRTSGNRERVPKPGGRCTVNAMAGGFWVLLDDVMVFAKLAAKSAARSGSKTAGVVIDDAAVTPAYVHDLAASRELPIIAKIAKKSLRNKTLFLLPVCLVLGMLDPRIVAFLLLLGALYLSYEAAAKLSGGHEHAAGAVDEAALVRQATRTDFVLSAEVMVIALNEVLDTGLALQAFSLLIVAVTMTASVYGVVALLVKGDDAGLHLAASTSPAIAAIGRVIVKATVFVLRVLALVGVAAMCWVGGHIFTEQAAKFSLTWPYETIHRVSHAFDTLRILPWFVETALYAATGLLVGYVLLLIRSLFERTLGRIRGK